MHEWKKQKAQLDSLPAKKRRLDGGGRKPAMPQLEEELSSWIENLRSGNFKVTRSSIQRKALEIAQEEGKNIMLAAS